MEAIGPNLSARPDHHLRGPDPDLQMAAREVLLDEKRTAVAACLRRARPPVRASTEDENRRLKQRVARAACPTFRAMSNRYQSKRMIAPEMLADCASGRWSGRALQEDAFDRFRERYNFVRPPTLLSSIAVWIDRAWMDAQGAVQTANDVSGLSVSDVAG